MFSIRRVCFQVFAVAVVSAPVALAQNLPSPITSCVSRNDGLTRIVSGPQGCRLPMETIVQWNRQGPAGPAGPSGDQGPIGPQGSAAATVTTLRHIILVPSSGTPLQNSQALAGTVASIKDASQVNPYTVQLDAGVYTFPETSTTQYPATGVLLPPFVSVKGSGIYATFVNAYTHTFIYSQMTNAEPTIATLSDMSISATTGYTVSYEGLSLLSVDHIAVTGYANFDSTLSNARIMITNSNFNGPTHVYAGNGHATISNSQVLSFYETNSSPGMLACFAVYDTNLVPYPQGCAYAGP